jgi:hypothetical protein
MDQGPRKAAPGAGAVLLHARDARIHGGTLRYEAAPEKDTLGFWVRKDDWAEWSFTAPGTGTFEIELLQGCGRGTGGAMVEIAVNGQKQTMKVVETGHFQRYVPVSVGMVSLTEREAYTLSVRALTKPGAAVMDLRRVTLKAAP